MRNLKVFIFIYILLMMFPVGAYAATDHSGHFGHGISTEYIPFEQQDSEHNRSQHGTSSPQAVEDSNLSSTEQGPGSSDEQGHGSSGHGEKESKSSVLEPVKNQIIAGILGFNALIIAAALAVKTKNSKGVINVG